MNNILVLFEFFMEMSRWARKVASIDRTRAYHKNTHIFVQLCCPWSYVKYTGDYSYCIANLIFKSLKFHFIWNFIKSELKCGSQAKLVTYHFCWNCAGIHAIYQMWQVFNNLVKIFRCTDNVQWLINAFALQNTE